MSKQTELAQVADTITVNSGNVGIGVLSPASGFLGVAALDVEGPVLARGGVAIHHTNAGVFQYNSNTTAIRSYGATANSGEITFTTGGGGTADSERMRIDSNGVLKINGGSAWNETNQGTGKGSIHLDPNSIASDTGGAITFGASDVGSGETAMAGIYTRSDSAYGTKMYLATTDSYANGPKTAVKVDHGGRVTTPRQPSFQVAGSGGWSSDITQDTWYTLPFNTTAFNTGGHYSTSSYIFTAPVAGKYLFIFNVYAHHNNAGDNNNYFSVRFGVNGAGVNYHSINGYQNQGDDDTTTSQSTILSLAQNDTVQVYLRGHGTTVRYYGNNCYFFGHLLG